MLALGASAGLRRAVAGWAISELKLQNGLELRPRAPARSTLRRDIAATLNSHHAETFAGKGISYSGQLQTENARILGEAAATERLPPRQAQTPWTELAPPNPAQLSLMARISEFLDRDFGGRGRRSLGRSPAAVSRPGRNRSAGSTAPSPRTRTPSSIEPAGPRNRPASGERRPPSS